jgi:radical SAM superfamily enzyme YgiQ (UPF0313 family)
MAHVLLIRGPLVFSAHSVSSPVTMPLSIAYLAASLLKYGHDASVIDALGEGLDHIDYSYTPRVVYRGLPTKSILDRITTRPDGIGVTSMFSQEWPHLEDMINALHAQYPDVPIIVGGEHATAASEYILRSCPAVSHIAVGEGEGTIVDYADYLDGTKPLDQIAGIQYLSASGALVQTPTRSRVKSPDDIPWPAWHLFDLEPYFAAGEGMGVARGRSMPILATRGCPYQCTFCSNPAMWTTRYVMRSIPQVVDEIESYLRDYKATNIDFFDLTAIVQKKWTLDFCHEVKRRGLQFTWQLPSGTRSEAMDAEVLEAMSSSGCMNVTYAPESGSVKVLADIKKKVRLPSLVSSIKAAIELGIVVKCNLIIGFPKETRWDMLQTFWFALKLAWMGVEDTGLYVFTPYPGSELYAALRKDGVLGPMNKEYFESMTSFMKLVPTVTYSEHVGTKEISFYRLVGMALFYSISFLRHPSRILRFVRNYRQHRADTTFEERLFERLRRMKLQRKSKTVALES